MADLQHVADENGVQRWETPDLSIVEYRAADGQRLRFEAYTGNDFLVKKKIGAKITTRRSRFEYAAIDNFYFFPSKGLDRSPGEGQAVGQEVYSFYPKSDSGSNGTGLTEQEQALIGGELPGTVRSWCRAQWHGANFSHEVRIGPFPSALSGGPPAFPAGFPGSWDAAGGIRVSPESLILTANFIGDTAVGSIQVRNREGSPQSITVNAPDNGHFLVTPKRYRLQAGETKNVGVKYENATRVGDAGRFTIITPQRQFVVQLRGAARQEAGHR